MSGPDLKGLAARESGADLGPLPVACPHCGDELTDAERERVRCGRCADTEPQVVVVAEPRAPLGPVEVVRPVVPLGTVGDAVCLACEEWRGDRCAREGCAPCLHPDPAGSVVAEARAWLGEQPITPSDRDAEHHIAALADECERLLAALAAVTERAERAERRLAQLELVVEAVQALEEPRRG